MGKQLSLLQTYGELAPIDTVKQLLVQESDIGAVKDFAIKAEKARKLYQYDKENKSRQDYFSELAIWSGRRLGQMIEQGQQDGIIAPTKGGRPKEKPLDDLTVLQLDDIVPNRNYAHRCKQLAKIPEAVIQQYVDDTKAKAADITKSGCILKAKDEQSLVKAKPKRISKESLGVHHCSFEDLEIENESVDLVFTDPPYDRASLPLYGPMLMMAARVLVPGGSCLCYCGHVWVPDVIDFARDAGLRYFWICATIHAKKAALTRIGVRAGWKPILWFTKGERFDHSQFVHDCVQVAAEKDDHQWQQPVAEATRFIESLSRPGHVVFDPFCGSGTTAVAAKELGRKWITCDVDADAVQVARGRLS